MRVSANKPKKEEGSRGRWLYNKSLFQTWGDTEAGADISASASLVRAAEVGLGSWVLGGCEGGQSGQGQKSCPDQRDLKEEGPAGEEMDSPFKGSDQWGPWGTRIPLPNMNPKCILRIWLSLQTPEMTRRVTYLKTSCTQDCVELHVIQ